VTWKIRWIGKDNIDRQKAEKQKSKRKYRTQRCIEDHAGTQKIGQRKDHMNTEKIGRMERVQTQKFGRKITKGK
jgi:hypothetical protein